MEDAISGSLNFPRMHIGYFGTSSLKKNQLNHFAQQEYLNYSAWILWLSSFILNGCCCGIMFFFLDMPNVTISDGKHYPAQKTSWLFWQFKFSHFKAWKLHYFHPNSGCSLVTRIEKNVPNEHQSDGFGAVISKVE